MNKHTFKEFLQQMTQMGYLRHLRNLLTVPGVIP
jgi:hypothetical protein